MRRYIPIAIVNAMFILAVIYSIAKREKRNTFFGGEQEIVNLSSGITIMEDSLYLEYERYITTMQADCENISRCGPNNDAGYDVCIDSAYKPTQPCLVYSFGSRFTFGFENDVYRRYKCRIHTFDPSIPIAGHRIPAGIKFHLIGLSDVNHKNIFGWNMKTLSTIRKLLNHSLTVLDILKIDIEGDEWKAIPQILASVSNKYIKQLVIETHFGRRTNGLKEDGFMSYILNYWGDANPFQQLNILKQLEVNGFMIFRSYKNPRAKLKLQYPNEDIVFTTYVVSLKNTNILT